ncbi:TPA: hypothetical protein GRI67_06080 [Vibrio parahaemolyticus]|uniref:hypothetical protein n=1 Tax=Vibrio parahaemolyticus TaxID=670 RepID=UPI001869BA7A|nr:hypothetical protein [Vibrio parahaemolyticus]EGR2227801.1 hypothetical protein [Vibrio parahaemolyticus]MBE3692138.1 hypothetical protein [Vibrio parahaemolyticus]MCI9690364.1 hypothetical protein [Vibrio parahaemolyticus]HAS6737789.1 hypothetical protein [Vibrio parahaemolyticus]HAS6753066.1 hypothetical protein [Vibrio parahaemolyticus]
MRKLANFELKAILEAIEHADFTNNYDFFSLLTCGISIEQIRAVYRLRSALQRDSTKTIFDYPLFLDQIYSNVESFYSVKEALGYEVDTQEIEREDKLIFLMQFLAENKMQLTIDRRNTPYSIAINLG